MIYNTTDYGVGGNKHNCAGEKFLCGLSNGEWCPYVKPEVTTTNSKVCVATDYCGIDEYNGTEEINDCVDTFLEARGLGTCTVTVTGYDSDYVKTKLVYNVKVVQMASMEQCKKYILSKNINIEEDELTGDSNLHFYGYYSGSNPYVPLYNFTIVYYSATGIPHERDCVINPNNYEITCIDYELDDPLVEFDYNKHTYKCIYSVLY